MSSLVKLLNNKGGGGWADLFNSHIGFVLIVIVQWKKMGSICVQSQVLI